MKYFDNISTLSDLKKRYRALYRENNAADNGKAVLQAIDDEFKAQFSVLKAEEVRGDADEPATGEAYAARFQREYNWCGERFRQTHEYNKAKIFDDIRRWLKETYPNCEFSVRKLHYDSYAVSLMKADFFPFLDVQMRYANINHYRIQDDPRLTDRCREVMENVLAYINSWNYDNSDSMTDYFDTNFYLDFEIGRSGRSFEYRPVRRGDAVAPQRRRKIGPVEKKVREAIGAGNAFLQRHEYNDASGQFEIPEDAPRYLCRDDENHYPLLYSQPSLVRARIGKLAAVGIEAKYEHGKIRLVRYSDELTAALEAERGAAEGSAAPAQQEDQGPAQTPETPAAAQHETPEEPAAAEGIRYVDYSAKAFAVVGETRALAQRLRELGGRFNPHLSCGAGWIFSKRRENDVRAALGEAAA